MPEWIWPRLTYYQTNNEEFMKILVQFSSGSVVWNWSSNVLANVQLIEPPLLVCNSFFGQEKVIYRQSPISLLLVKNFF